MPKNMFLDKFLCSLSVNFFFTLFNFIKDKRHENSLQEKNVMIVSRIKPETFWLVVNNITLNQVAR